MVYRHGAILLVVRECSGFNRRHREQVDCERDKVEVGEKQEKDKHEETTNAQTYDIRDGTWMEWNAHWDTWATMWVWVHEKKNTCEVYLSTHCVPLRSLARPAIGTSPNCQPPHRTRWNPILWRCTVPELFCDVSVLPHLSGIEIGFLLLLWHQSWFTYLFSSLLLLSLLSPLFFASHVRLFFFLLFSSMPLLRLNFTPSHVQEGRPVTPLTTDEIVAHFFLLVACDEHFSALSGPSSPPIFVGFWASRRTTGVEQCEYVFMWILGCVSRLLKDSFVVHLRSKIDMIVELSKTQTLLKYSSSMEGCLMRSKNDGGTRGHCKNTAEKIAVWRLHAVDIDYVANKGRKCGYSAVYDDCSVNSRRSWRPCQLNC